METDAVYCGAWAIANAALGAANGGNIGWLADTGRASQRWRTEGGGLAQYSGDFLQQFLFFYDAVDMAAAVDDQMGQVFG